MQSKLRNWGDARIFLAVARRGSTLAASKDLGMTQTTVARRIDTLEAALGLTLFSRDTQGFHLTENGRALVTPAEAVEAAALEFVDVANSMRDQSGPIRISAADHKLEDAMGLIIAQFAGKYPGTSFEFRTTQRTVDLSGGEADIALRFASEPPDDSLVCRQVGAVWWAIYASAAYIKANGQPRTMEETHDHPYILMKHIPTERENVIWVDNSTDIIMNLHAARGVGPLVCHNGEADAGLVRCFTPPGGGELTAYLVASQSANKRRDVRRFMAFAAPKIAEHLAMLATFSSPEAVDGSSKQAG